MRTPPVTPLSAEILGRITLIQSMIVNLPDKIAVMRFVARGLEIVPGTGWIGYRLQGEDGSESASALATPQNIRSFRLQINGEVYGRLQIEVRTPDLFDPYIPYIQNLCFMLAVIFEERRQRQLNRAHQDQLEKRVLDRTQQLEKEIEERSKVASALRASEERLRLAMEATQDGLWDWNVKTGEVYWNPRCYTMLGFQPGEFAMTIDKWSELVHPEDRELVWPEIQRKLEGEGGSFNIEFRYATKGGAWIWINGRGRPSQWDAHGRVVRMVGTHVDISERKAADLRLRKSEARLNVIFQANPDPVVVYDLRGYPRRVNQAFKTVFGWRMSELKNRLNPFVPEHQREITRSKIKEVYASGLPLRFETQRFTKDGRLLDMIISAATIQDESGHRSGMVANLTDITEKKRLEQQLQQSQKMEAVGTLAGGIAHDFNNILGIVLGNSELAVDDLPEWSPVRHNLGEIRRASLRAKDVVRQLLSFSRKSEHRKKPLDIALILKESLQLLRASIPATVEIQSKIPIGQGIINADPTQVHQVMINLCTNAAHAMEAQGGLLEVSLSRIQLDSQSAEQYHQLEPGKYVQLRVRDNGSGIAPEIKDRVFDPYFSTKDRDKGTGIGLSVVHGIVINHDGAITIDSHLGRGTTVNVLLPHVPQQPMTIEEDKGALPGGKERILLVDDEPALVEMGTLILERLGYTVSPHTDPRAALSEFKSNPEGFNLLISDMTMPGMTGVQLVEAVQTIRPRLPIILCTGYSQSLGSKQAAAIGVRRFMDKPILKRDLALSVREVLDGI